jgi:hypothetical protein
MGEVDAFALEEPAPMKPATTIAKERRASVSLGVILGGCLVLGSMVVVILPLDGSGEASGALSAAAFRLFAERGVMLFQTAGILMLALAKLAPPGIWTSRGAMGVMISQVGLTITGMICSRFYSDFALFAGATVVALFLGMLWASDIPAAEAQSSPPGDF